MPQKPNKRTARESKKSALFNKLGKSGIQNLVGRALLTMDPVIFQSVIKNPNRNPDEAYQLVLAAANQAIQQFDKSNLPRNMKPPTEMGVDVEFDPRLTKTEIRYNFSSSKFTIYTPDDLDEVFSSGERNITKEESLRNALSEALPSAQFRLFYNQGVLLANGNEKSFRERFLPDQFRKTRKKSKRKVKNGRK